MPNDSRSRRDKKEKEKKRKDKKNSKPLRRKPSAADSDTSSSDKDDTHAEKALAISVSHIGGKAVTRKGNPSSEALDNSLSSFVSLLVFFSRSEGFFEWRKEQLSLPQRRGRQRQLLRRQRRGNSHF
jgi:hypothetical protein